MATRLLGNWKKPNVGLDKFYAAADVRKLVKEIGPTLPAGTKLEITQDGGDSAESSLDRLTDLVTNLLDLSRLRAGALPVLIKPVGLDDIVAHTLLITAPDVWFPQKAAWHLVEILTWLPRKLLGAKRKAQRPRPCQPPTINHQPSISRQWV